MMILTDRTDMAVVMNFGKYPVLKLDLDNKPYLEKEFVKGGTVRVAWDDDRASYEGMSSDCNLVMEKGDYSLMQGGTALKASYSIGDFLEDVATANTPLIHKDQTVAVAHYSLRNGMYFIRMMKVSSKININRMDVALLHDITDEDRREVEQYIKRKKRA